MLHQADRERNKASFDPTHRSEVLARIASAQTIGELALLMDAEGWRRAGMMHMLVQVAVPDLPRNEFVALASIR